jgi:23S rRNA pseudouridine1911/1915/1917 synthase
MKSTKQLNPTILFETDDLLVINKPAGLIVHGDGKHDESSVVDWVVKKYPETKGVGEPMTIEHEGEDIPIERSGIVHRIDRDTSGCLVIAKNQDTFLFLKEQFKEHTIKKKYVAIVYGWPRDERGLIDQPIGRSKSDIRAWTTKAGTRGTMRPATTRFSVRKKFEFDRAKYAIVDLYPQTGRTHQLRVHLAHLGHPIVGDPLYAGKRETSLSIHRTALHAERITFQLPGGREQEVQAPLPEDLASLIKV